MRAIIQRVTSGSVTVESKLISKINNGFVIFIGINKDDTVKQSEWISSKILKLKLFPDGGGGGGGQWKKNIIDIGGDILCISQFTLYAKCKKSTKPDFHIAAPGNHAQELYNHVLNQLKINYNSNVIKDGIFGEMMKVELVNDGPVTIIIDSDE